MTSLFLFSDFAEAQKIKIKKAKGTAAVIESSIPLEEGQIYELAVQSVSQDVDFRASSPKSRINSLSLGGNFFTGKGDNFSQTEAELTARYGWNYTVLEFGPVGSLSFLDEGAGASTLFQFGGYFDYNLISNRDPKIWIYGPTASLTFGTRSFPDSQGGGSASIINLNAGGFLSWFINGGPTAFRVEGYLDFRQVSTTARQTNITGLGGKLFVLYYF